ncbi:MAG: glycosyltransferase [Frankiaceae bacterium]|jgi:GT2 family glycosyltransferase|nr:glycosyltransferase [Frankiaceae bacterium]
MGAGLVVAVLTFRRTEHIVELAPLLVSQARETLAAFPDLGAVEVLVVDNDPAASARAPLASVPGIRYVHEPEPGISAGRNRALDEAGDAGLLAFIDDDERPTPGWLVNLVRAQRESGAAGVVGRVERVFPVPLDPWIAAGEFFNSAHQPSGTAVPAAATNNLLLDLGALRRHGMRFDGRLGLIGGEDTRFSRALIRRGEAIIWCDEAVVDDQIPVHRMTRRWVLVRRFRAGNSDGLASLLLAGSAAGRLGVRLRYLLRGALRCAGGGARAAAGTLVRDQRIQATGARTCARGLGMLAAALGYRYREYARL